MQLRRDLHGEKVRLQELTNSLEKARDERDQADEQAKDLRAELGVLKDRKTGLQAEIDEFESEAKDRAEKLAETEESLAKAKLELGDVQKVRAEIAEKEKELAELHGKISSARKERHRLEENNEDICALVDDFDVNRRKIQERIFDLDDDLKLKDERLLATGASLAA